MDEQVYLETKIDLDTLTFYLSDLPNELLLEFIQKLDERVGEWDFTVLVRDHFNGLDYSEVEG
jgi:hypothetical protein